jgi:hypothetical protein
MGYKGVMTGHGWRGIASTVLHENGFEDDHVAVQLAHLKRNKVRASHDLAKYLPQRKKLMQSWANNLEKQWNTPV